MNAACRSLLVLILVLSWAPLVSGTTFIVDTNSIGGTCNDGNPGTTTQPRCTAAAGMALLTAGAGDTLYLRQGSYARIADPPCFPSGSSWFNPTIIASFPGETASVPGILLNGTFGSCGVTSYIVFDRLVIDGNLDPGAETGLTTFDGVHHTRFQNGEIKNIQDAGGQIGGLGVAYFGNSNSPFNTGFHEIIKTKIHDNVHRFDSTGYPHGGFGFYIQDANVLIDGCEIYNNPGYAIQFYNGYTFTGINNVIVRNNIIYNNGYALGYGAITMNHGDNFLAYNNLIYNNFNGFEIIRGSSNAKVFNNTFYNNQVFAVRLDIGGQDTTNAIVQNNIVWQNGSSGMTTVNCIEVGGAPNPTVSHNLCSNPSMVNPGGSVFTLQPGSAAINAGITVAAVPNDLEGLTRPQGPAYDIGAYEFQQGGGALPTGNDIYVSVGGHGDTPSDGDGSVQSCINAENITTPKATVPGICPCMTVPGKKVRFRGGTYTATLDTLNCPITGGTSWAAPTTLTAHLNEAVTLALPSGQQVVAHFQNSSTDSYILMRNLIVDAMNRAGSNGVAFQSGAHHIRLEGVTIRNTLGGGSCAYLNGADNIEFTGDGLIENCGTTGIGVDGAVNSLLVERQTIRNYLEYGLRANVTSGSHTNLIVARNVLHTTSPSGSFPAIAIGPGTGPVVVNNIAHSGQVGIRVYSGAIGPKLYNNTVASNAGAGILCDSGASGALITNNISFGNGTDAIGTACSPTLTTNMVTNPVFTNAGADDYTLGATSTAINAGTTLAEVQVAIDGIMRPQGIAYDIGAYERDAPPPPPDPTLKHRVPVYIQSWFQ